MITIRNKEEMEEYYVRQVNTYVIEDDVEFLFDVDVDSNIKARNISAHNITAHNIYAYNIKAHNIEAVEINACKIEVHNINAFNIGTSDIIANDISYFVCCYALNNIECNSIKGKFTNSKHFVLEGRLVVKGE